MASRSTFPWGSVEAIRAVTFRAAGTAGHLRRVDVVLARMPHERIESDRWEVVKGGGHQSSGGLATDCVATISELGPFEESFHVNPDLAPTTKDERRRS
jgi:hypothetical protein